MTTRISSCCQEAYSDFANSRHLCHDETRFRLGPSHDKAAAYCGLDQTLMEHNGHNVSTSRSHRDADAEFVASLPHREVLHACQKPSQDFHERSYAFTSIGATSRTSKNYSHLSAIIGSTRMARRAGI